jgi:hypothetical protein
MVQRPTHLKARVADRRRNDALSEREAERTKDRETDREGEGGRDAQGET